MDEAADPRLAIALDVANLDLACQMANAVQPWMGVAKVGLELFAAAGPTAVTAMTQRGFEVFLDLKLHDIPTTVGRAALQAGRTGARWLTVHTCAGAQMLGAAVEGLAQGSSNQARVLGVTILTSQTNRSSGLLQERVGVAQQTGCGGVICAAADIAAIKAMAPELLLVVPGIRLTDSAHNDQAAVATPQQALVAGASMLVIGRTVTNSVQEILTSLAVNKLPPSSVQMSEALADVADRAAQLAASVRGVTTERS